MEHAFTAGVDEAGRGALAGPVVAGACILTAPLFRRRGPFPAWSPIRNKLKKDLLIADSKLLSPEEREQAFSWITAHCQFGIGIVSAFVIEKRGILYATEQAMRLAVEELRAKTHVEQLLVDGRDRFRFPVAHKSIIRGDTLDPCIAAASIVAKVSRDRLMCEMHEHFPVYGFSVHKGYGTQDHIDAIKHMGPCPMHRHSFLSRILLSKPSLMAALPSAA